MKLYSPALITSKGKITNGHGANLVWCDVLGRRQKQIGGSVEYFFPSWNHQGKRNGKIGQTIESKLEIIEKELSEQLSLFGIDAHREYRDNSQESRKNSQKYFTILKERNFIEQEGYQYFLDIRRIVERTNFSKILEEIKFAQGIQIKRRLSDLVHTVNGMYPISKPREFATDIPEGKGRNSQKINPIFDLAVSPLIFSEESVDYSVDGSRTLFHGTFLPLVIWAGLSNKPFSKNISIHGYAVGDSKMDVNEFYRNIDADILNSDVMRYCAIQSTESFKDTEVNLDNIKGAKKLLYRTLNLSKHILKHYGVQKRDEKGDENLIELIDNMNHPKVIRNFESETFAISRDAHHKGKVSKNNITRFLRNINVIKSVFPTTIRRVEEIIYYGKQ